MIEPATSSDDDGKMMERELEARSNRRGIVMIAQNPPEEFDVSPYYGKFVAWNLSRTRIVASADDEEEVYRLVDAMNEPLDQVIFSYVPRPDEVIMGAAALLDYKD